ncbi:neurotrophin 1 isoform X2 [Cephus cinctus]|uniref:Neurotrophin 1 isoform X2 n=1 Tax=Cephus cinctus TaxID=211228 RepID=A0AAJ7BUV4_CEPCN|nr:neurotrophin 1 isoform X2 [Cephus cinctus]
MIPRADNVLGPPLFTTALTLLLVVQMTGSFPHSIGHTSNPRLQEKTAYRAEDQPENQAMLGARNVPTRIDSTQADEKIVFPSEDNESQVHRFVPGPESVCRGTTYCEHSPDYPENYIKTAIRTQESLKYFTGVDEVVNIIQRIDDSPLEETQLCVSTEQVIIPKSAENRDKQWRYIVNHGNVTQGVRIERNEGSECKILESSPNGYKTSCKQKYIYRQLMALMANGSVSPDVFRFPASCCCHAKFTGNLLTRMGMDIGKANLSEKRTSSYQADWP